MRLSCFSLIILLLGHAAATAERYPAANGLERSLVAEQPLLRNPVSLSVDTDGTIFVTETARRKVADLDIREFATFGWIEQDLALTSVAEKEAFFREQLDGEQKFSGTSLKDWDGDQKITSKDLTTMSERVVRISDQDGDGVYETSNVFAENFNTEVTGIAAGVLAWRGDVYATIAPDLWKLRDTTGDGVADLRESLVHGFGIHIAYAGHDMHGLTPGPDGRIYWTIGDKGTHVISQEGRQFLAPHEGAVLRCYPDGSGFEIFARGLRNPQEIAFDRYGNIFSVDNDSDQRGERERFLHITEGSDSGWRNYYQYRRSQYNPWMEESLSVPSGELQPAYITPTNANYSDGPAGFAFNPGTALNEKYKDSFFVTEFPKGNLRSFQVRPKGATFEIVGDHVVLSGVANVGITIGPDGALYAADWGGGYPLNSKGAIWKIDDPISTNSEGRKEVAQLLRAGPAKIASARLVEQLAHPDQRIRLQAQWELVERGAEAEFRRAASAPNADEMTVVHSLWGLSQLKVFDRTLFEQLAGGQHPELRAQAARYASESQAKAVPALDGLLQDSSLRVRSCAATSIWRLGMSQSLDAIIEMLAENGDRDAYLRHAGVLALTAAPPQEIAAKTLGHGSASVRLAAAVAFRRLSSPLVAQLLQDSDPRVVTEAARAIFDEPAIEEGYPALADLIRENPSAQAPAIRRSIAANRSLADSQSALRLANFATLAEVPEALRVVALQALASWTESSKLNAVDGRYDPMAPAERVFVKAAYEIVFEKLQDDPAKSIAAATANLSKSLGLVGSAAALVREVVDPDREAPARIQSLVALSGVDAPRYKEILPTLLEDSAPEVRAYAASQLVETDPATVFAYAVRILKESDDISERQQAVLTLAKANDAAAKSVLISLAEEAQKAPERDAAILLEITEAVPAAKDILASRVSLAGGEAALGEQIFNEHLGAQCTACHRIGSEGSRVGPPLDAIGKQSRQHILQSMLEPQAVLAAGYGLMTIKTKSGETLFGNLKEETSTALTLILSDETERELQLSEIESKSQPLSTMPAMGAILSARELRDLVEYLAQQK